MTSSDGLRRKAEAIVCTLRDQLDEQRLARDIDQPIDRALATFRFDWRTPPSVRQFHRTIGSLVAHLYTHGFAVPRRLSPAQAMAEAIELLDAAYQGTHERGYDGAVLDALTERGSGIDSVLARLAEIIKLRQRYRHRQWAFARHLDPLDWPLRCAVVTVILEAQQPTGGTALADCPAAQLVDHVPELLESELGTDAMLDQLVVAALQRH